MRTVTARKAAGLLGVTPSTLRAWEERFGYPERTALSSGRPGYSYEEVIALRDALIRELSISTAIMTAKQRAGHIRVHRERHMQLVGSPDHRSSDKP